MSDQSLSDTSLQSPVPQQPSSALPQQAPQAAVTSESFPERPYEEARMREDGTEVPNFDPANPDHQEARLKHSNDYLVGDLKELGYEAPVY